jgi:hypothetical protein
MRLLESYLLNKKVEITLVFDGNHPPFPLDGQPGRSLRVIFSNYPFKADPVIKRLIEKERKKRSLSIVSDDADIIKFAKTQEVGVLSTGVFYSRLVKRFEQENDFYKKFDRELSEEELAEWKKIFGVK